jgi:hypothetical protein
MPATLDPSFVANVRHMCDGIRNVYFYIAKVRASVVNEIVYLLWAQLTIAIIVEQLDMPRPTIDITAASDGV